MPSLLVKGFVAALAIASGLGQTQWSCPEQQKPVPVFYNDLQGNQRVLQSCLKFDENGERELSFKEQHHIRAHSSVVEVEDQSGQFSIYINENQ